MEEKTLNQGRIAGNTNVDLPCRRLRGRPRKGAGHVPGGNVGTGVEVKPLRPAGSAAQGAGPQQPGRHREEEKERRRRDNEEVRETKDTVGETNKEVGGTDEEDEDSRSEMTTEEKTEIGDGQQDTPMWTSHPEN
ncbi:hypothetical protein NDU88_002798 [Pleurodeles waltl]|uniref:Uncharacterized protein n=1 Tax=Pleurodeles waltl TaxID=8319 RepID=A0AAV7RCZ1_PLEWA|nr:hypothetical protein NDU88_002798 [Pleurodeles waltl]